MEASSMEENRLVMTRLARTAALGWAALGRCVPEADGMRKGRETDSRGDQPNTEGPARYGRPLKHRGFAELYQHSAAIDG